MGHWKQEIPPSLDNYKVAATPLSPTHRLFYREITHPVLNDPHIEEGKLGKQDFFFAFYLHPSQSTISTSLLLHLSCPTFHFFSPPLPWKCSISAQAVSKLKRCVDTYADCSADRCIHLSLLARRQLAATFTLQSLRNVVLHTNRSGSPPTLHCFLHSSFVWTLVSVNLHRLSAHFHFCVCFCLFPQVCQDILASKPTAAFSICRILPGAALFCWRWDDEAAVGGLKDVSRCLQETWLIEDYYMKQPVQI